MTHLLDVDVLVALADASHVHHGLVHRWFGSRRGKWATCPLTQNGLVRVIANPRYPGNGLLLPDAIAWLKALLSHPDHTFWADDISIADGRFVPSAFQGHNQLTDGYLLGLAEHHAACFVTLDRRVTERLLSSGDSSRVRCLLP